MLYRLTILTLYSLSVQVQVQSVGTDAGASSVGTQQGTDSAHAPKLEAPAKGTEDGNTGMGMGMGMGIHCRVLSQPRTPQGMVNTAGLHPCLSSSKHHAVCMEDGCLDLIKLCALRRDRHGHGHGGGGVHVR